MKIPYVNLVLQWEKEKKFLLPLIKKNNDKTSLMVFDSNETSKTQHLLASSKTSYEESKSKIDFMEEKKALGTYKEIRRRKPDLIKAKMMIGYKPKTKFKESLNRVIKEISK